MLIRLGYDIQFEIPQTVAMVGMLNVHPSRAADLREVAIGTQDIVIETCTGREAEYGIGVLLEAAPGIRVGDGSDTRVIEDVLRIAFLGYPE